MPPEFNVEQQAFLEAARQGKDWTWSALRPSVVCGDMRARRIIPSA
jgi:hypothetical protein